MNTPATPPKWGDLLRYTTDDRDITEHQLCIMQGGNGDWYVSISESPDHHPTNGIRLCTSGGAAHACPGLGRAIAAAYRALYNQAQRIQPNNDNHPEPWAHALWKHLHEEHGLTLLESEIHEIIRHATPFVTELAQAKQDIADLNTRLIERQQDMMARIVQLRNDLRAATKTAINLAHKSITEPDPYQTEDYQRYVAKVAETCESPNCPCDACLAGGICDGPTRSREYMDNQITDNDE